MYLGNPSKVLVHYLLIRGMTCLDHWDRVPIVSTLVCKVTHLIRLIVSRDISDWVVMTSPSYYVA